MASGSGSGNRILVDGSWLLVCKMSDFEYAGLGFTAETQRARIPYPEIAPYVDEVKTPAPPAFSRETALEACDLGFDHTGTRIFVKILGAEVDFAPIDAVGIAVEYIPMSRRLVMEGFEKLRVAGLVVDTGDPAASLWQTFFYQVVGGLYKNVPGLLDGSGGGSQVAVADIPWSHVLNGTFSVVFRYGDVGGVPGLNIVPGKTFGLVLRVYDNSVMKTSMVFVVPVDPVQFFGIDYDLVTDIPVSVQNIRAAGGFVDRTTMCNVCGLPGGNGVHLRVCGVCQRARYCSLE